MEKEKNRKKKAYFQDDYRSSSNFGRTRLDDKVDPQGDGTLEYPKTEGKVRSEIQDTVDDLLGEEE